jgi:hypothetical protein
MLTVGMDDETPKRLNMRTTVGEDAAWREGARIDHCNDLSEWLRRLAWARIEAQKREKAPPKKRR